MEKEERHLKVVQTKNGRIKGYENHEENNFISEEDITGFDANVLVDLADSEEFKEEIRAQVKFNVLKIYTTSIALGEARHVLIKKRKYSFDDATKKLKEILNEFSIEKIDHTDESDKMGNEWVNIVKGKMFIKKFDTFPNDCKIVSNLYNQKNINVYFTEDKDIEMAIKLLKIKLRVKIIPAAENLSNFKIKEFFNQKNKAFYKKHKRS